MTNKAQSCSAFAVRASLCACRSKSVSLDACAHIRARDALSSLSLPFMRRRNENASRKQHSPSGTCCTHGDKIRTEKKVDTIVWFVFALDVAWLIVECMQRAQQMGARDGHLRVSVASFLFIYTHHTREKSCGDRLLLSAPHQKPLYVDHPSIASTLHLGFRVQLVSYLIAQDHRSSLRSSLPPSNLACVRKNERTRQRFYKTTQRRRQLSDAESTKKATSQKDTGKKDSDMSKLACASECSSERSARAANHPTNSRPTARCHLQHRVSVLPIRLLCPSACSALWTHSRLLASYGTGREQFLSNTGSRCDGVVGSKCTRIA